MEDCAMAAGAGAVVTAGAGGLDCASAGTIITDASTPPIKSLERMREFSRLVELKRYSRTRRELFRSWNSAGSMVFLWMGIATIVRCNWLRPARSSDPPIQFGATKWLRLAERRDALAR